MAEKLENERVALIRNRIEAHCRRVDFTLGYPLGTTNKALKAHFGKGREEQTEKELTRVWTYLVKTYPLQESV